MNSTAVRWGIAAERQSAAHITTSCGVSSTHFLSLFSIDNIVYLHIKIPFSIKPDIEYFKNDF